MMNNYFLKFEIVEASTREKLRFTGMLSIPLPQNAYPYFPFPKSKPCKLHYPSSNKEERKKLV